MQGLSLRSKIASRRLPNLLRGGWNQVEVSALFHFALYSAQIYGIGEGTREKGSSAFAARRGAFVELPLLEFETRRRIR